MFLASKAAEIDILDVFCPALLSNLLGAEFIELEVEHTDRFASWLGFASFSRIGVLQRGVFVFSSSRSSGATTTCIVSTGTVATALSTGTSIATRTARRWITARRWSLVGSGQAKSDSFFKILTRLQCLPSRGFSDIFL